MQESGLIKSWDGTQIYWQGWRPKGEIRGLILISHGLGEHIDRYADLAGFLNQKGFAVFGCDHRGHGKSGGKRGHIMSFDEYIRDVKLFRDSVVDRFPGKKKFLLGHSMGGLIAVHYQLERPNDFDRVVLSSPALKNIIEVNPFVAAIGRVMSRILPGTSLSNKLDPNMISHDPEVVKKYINDPLVHDRVSTRWFVCFVAAMAEAHRRAGEIKVPILVMQSSEDKLVHPAGAREFFSELGSKDKTLQYWEGFYHEMFNEVGKEKAYQFLLDWLNQHLA